MDFNRAFEQIREKYDIRKVTLDCASIDSEIMIDEFNGLAVGLVQKDDKTFLTDYADLVNDFPLDIDEVETICKNNNVEFNNYSIDKEYNSLDDLEQYLKCIEEIIKTLEE